MPLTDQDRALLKASNKPQAHGGEARTPDLILQWEERPNILTPVDGRTGSREPCIIISDRTSYLCATRDLSLVQELLKLEAGKLGSVRELATGHPPRHWYWRGEWEKLRLPKEKVSIELKDLNLGDLI